MWSPGFLLVMAFLTLTTSQIYYSSTEEYGEYEPSSENYPIDRLNVNLKSNVTCPPGEFPCYKTSICIPRELHCNGVVDCPNGVDENKDNCVNYSPVGDQVHKLMKDFALLNETEAQEYFTECFLPPNSTLREYNCYCRKFTHKLGYNRTMLQCENNSTLEIFPEIPAYFNQVSFMGGQIKYLPDNFNKYRHWIVLSIMNNKIRVLRKGVFSGLVLLTRLHLDGNLIHTIESGAFEGMKNLNSLYLDRNNLSHFDSTNLKDTPKLKSIFLDRNKITLAKFEKFYVPPGLRWLLLSQNRIKYVKSSMFDENSSSLVYLNLSRNEIEEVDEYAFKYMGNLTELSLMRNKISYLKPKTFFGLISLNSLDLAYNPITTLPIEIFSELLMLDTLNLKDIEFTNINIRHFERLKEAQYIFFKKFRYCSYAPLVRLCYPRMDGVSSTEHLLVWPILRLSVWVVALVTIISNVVVFAWRLISRKEDRVLSLFVKNLSVADLLMGIYLLSVAIQDVIYRGVYNRYAMTWMTSWRCLVCGVLAMLSCEVSVLILSLITFERYRCIRTNVRVVTEKAAKFALLGVWSTGLLLALLPLFQMDGFHSFYANNGLCFPLHIHDPYMTGWQYSAFVFLGVNLIAVLLIITLYLWMFLKIKHDRRRSRPVLLKQREDAVLARRFFFIVLTDCMCWIPIIIIKILALGGIPINDDLYAFLVVFILPVNSALNPVIYTLAAPTELRRRIGQIVPGKWFCKTRHSFASSESKTANSSMATQSSSLNDGRSNSNGTVISIPAMASVPCTILESSNEESDVGDETKL